MDLPRFSISRWLPWILLLIGIAAFLKWQSAVPSVNYITGTIVRGTLEDAVSSTGTLQAKEYVDIGAQVSGILQKIHIQIGQTVNKGDLLAEIDPTLFQAQMVQGEAILANLAAQMDAAQATLKLAEQRLTRNKNLLKSDAVSQDELNSSQADYSRAQAALESLGAQIDQAKGGFDATKASLDRTKIYAPISGSVTQIQAREGQTLNASQTAPILLRLANLDTMRVQAQVSEADIERIHVGMSAYFTTLGDPDTHHDGTVRVITPSSLNSTPPVFYNTIFDVPNDKHALLPDMTAQVYFPLVSRTNALIIPLAALDYAKHQLPPSELHSMAKAKNPRPTKVFVLGDNDKTEVVEVILGIRNRVFAEVISGLSEGDEVITGPMELRPKSRPRVMIR
ncbi:MAG: efflux RND transporter periplasmic adaptor subunit [Verrucomicrobia bacterium]|nr:efflux RND transporter periplasmic adaptor subunit [Verrucomicrobiota bacterium]